VSADEYPFGRAKGSFVLAGATPPRALTDPPLLAFGANAAPEVLARKLPGVPVAAVVGTLRGFAVVHSAHVSPYGAVPATLVPHPGGSVAVHALVLGGGDPAAALAALDATEPNYDRVTLRGIELALDGLGTVSAAEAYVSKHGPLVVDGAPVALGALSQPELRALL
jgi:hypothetical protein